MVCRVWGKGNPGGRLKAGIVLDLRSPPALRGGTSSLTDLVETNLLPFPILSLNTFTLSLALSSLLSSFLRISRWQGLTLRKDVWLESKCRVIVQVTVKNFVSPTLEVEIPPDSIAKTHRLGNYYIEMKCRPMFVRFSSSKVRNQVFFNKSKPKGTGISVGEDFCKPARSSQKTLLDYTKASGQQYTLRYSKLYINKKCFIYCSKTDKAYDISQVTKPSVSSGPSALGTTVTSPTV